jgi:hypothetical protein
MRIHGQKHRQVQQGKHGDPGRPAPAATRNREVRSILHVQRTADASQPDRELEAPSLVHEVLATPGHPLDPATRGSMEHRFGQDFSHVRVHSDAKAAQSAEAVDALAYTAGRDVVFGAGRYAPGTSEGDHLLAHELAHTVQQGPTANTIQRALKFEFQTLNHVWAVKKSGAPKPELLPRKYAPTTKGYKEGSGEESGDKPAFLAAGQKGGPAKKKGDFVFVEAEGPLVLEEAKPPEFDPAKAAQFVREYKFKTQVKETDILGKPVGKGRQLELVRETDNAKDPAMSGLFNPNTFELQYFNQDGTQLDVHLSKSREFKKDHVKLMKVGRGKSGIDETKAAQTVEIFKVTDDPAGPVDFLGTPAKVERVSVVDNAKDKAMKGQFNPGTWEKKYFLAADFAGEVLSSSATPLDVHMDTDGRLKPGQIKFMKREKLAAAREQTAIELQSESEGAIEFETPKWFRRFSEIQERIQEAVDMTKTINDQRGIAGQKITDPALLSEIDTKKKSDDLGEVVEWPDSLSTAHLKKLNADKRKLLVQIVDDTWIARIQASEGIALSEYGSLMEEHEEPWARDIVAPNADSIFATAFADAKAKKSDLEESRFANLKGFLQLVVTYIVRGQVEDVGHIPKDVAFLMARTNFGSMHKELLSAEEKALFKAMVGKKASDSPILSALEVPINAERSRRGLGSVTLTRPSPFFFSLPGGKRNPQIHKWLKGITENSDLLSGVVKGISDAMGAKTVQKKPGEKDFKQALFEVRRTAGHGASLTPEGRIDDNSVGNDRPASGWVSFAKDIFDAAKARSADTPDDPTTPKVNESSKTALID